MQKRRLIIQERAENLQENVWKKIKRAKIQSTDGVIRQQRIKGRNKGEMRLL